MASRWGAAGGPCSSVAAGPPGGAAAFGIAAEVEDAVFDIADRVDDPCDACGAESFLAGVAGASHAECAVVADASDPHRRAGR